MTIEEFNVYRFSSDDKIKYFGQMYHIKAIDFGEALIGFYTDDDYENILWARCENVELINL